MSLSLAAVGATPVQELISWAGTTGQAQPQGLQLSGLPQRPEDGRHDTAPPSATQLSLAAAKEDLAEAAGDALRKAVRALSDAIVACQSTAWTGMGEAVGLLEEAGRLLQHEEPGNPRPAAQAYDRVDEARRIEDCPTDTKAVLKAAARAVRDVVVLRCCLLTDLRSRSAFENEIATAFQRPIIGELRSQLAHAYNTLTSSKQGCDVLDAFTESNQLYRTRRPRKKGPGGDAEGFIHMSGAASCGTVPGLDYIYDPTQAVPG
jgi:hypothetical protein